MEIKKPYIAEPRLFYFYVLEKRERERERENLKREYQESYY